MNRLLITSLFFIFFTLSQNAFSQLKCTNHTDRNWWNVLHYNLEVDFNIEELSIQGINTITAVSLKNHRSVLQLDLQLPMVIDSVYLVATENSIPFLQDGDMSLIMLPFNGILPGDTFQLKVYYHGFPKLAVNAPWDGGLVDTTAFNFKWLGMACQGLGASVWFPCKDYPGDEPDMGVELTYKVPAEYTAIGNGKLVSEEKGSVKNIFQYCVTQPINLYSISFYIGRYMTFEKKYQGLSGTLPVTVQVLESNWVKVPDFIRQIEKMLTCFETWFGPYPFYKDGFKIVEAPYLGMEHQSAIAYGNGFKPGYNGSDRSGTGEGLKFDFILIHEAAHEWFGNSISINDVADGWIHEAFASYAEMLYLECYEGMESAERYQRGKWKNISNDGPVVGKYGQCDQGSLDRYDKGAALVHLIRKVLDNDSLFHATLIVLNKRFYHKTVNSKDFELTISEVTGFDFSSIFQQYLHHNYIPELEVEWRNNELRYRWSNTSDDFNMPIQLIVNEKSYKILPTNKWQNLSVLFDQEHIVVIDQNYLVSLKLGS